MTINALCKSSLELNLVLSETAEKFLNSVSVDKGLKVVKSIAMHLQSSLELKFVLRMQ